MTINDTCRIACRPPHTVPMRNSVELVLSVLHIAATSGRTRSGYASNEFNFWTRVRASIAGGAGGLSCEVGEEQRAAVD